MLLVKTLIAPSTIHGVGLFADQDISKRTILWRFNPHFDIVFDDPELKNVPDIQRDFIRHFGYLSQKLGKFVLCTDGAMFMNHSSTPNSGEISEEGGMEDSNIALRDIAKGEELTVDYRLFDLNDKNNPPEYIRNTNEKES